MPVSAVIPCFNRANYIAEAIRSAIPEADEVVVVDDGSTDQSWSIISQFKVKAIRTENRGVSAARNAGIEAASSNLVRFLDSDDMIEPGSTKALLNGPADYIPVGRATVIEGSMTYGFGDHIGEIAADLLLSRTLPAVLCLFPRSVRFDERLTISEDYELAARLHAEGRQFYAIAETVYRVRDHSGPRLTRAYGPDGYRAQLEAMKAASRHMTDPAPAAAACWSLGRAAARDGHRREANALFSFARRIGASGYPAPYWVERAWSAAKRIRKAP